MLRCLVRVWFARIAREGLAGLLQTPFRQVILERVAWQDPMGNHAGCVLAVLHSPWARVMAAWCNASGYSLVLVDGRWERRVGKSIAPGGIRGLREITRHLKTGGRVAAIVDSFPPTGASMEFLGAPVRASLVAARVASVAKVAVVPVVFFWRSGRLVGRFGPACKVAPGRGGAMKATSALLSFIEQEIRREPAVWNNVLKDRAAW